MIKNIIPTAASLVAVVAPSAQAASSAPPSLIGSPQAAFVKSSNDGNRSYTMAVVVRFDRTLPRTGSRVVIGPGLKNGQDIGGRVEGGDTPRPIGIPARHCYDIEVGRPRPVSTPRPGARWEVGVTREGIIGDTATTTLRAFPAGGGFGPAEARRLGCFATSNSASVVGQRMPVLVTQLLVYDDPAKSYTGSLQKGQSFKVLRLSRSKTYAYGYAYGSMNRLGWVRTSKLINGS